MQKRSWLRFFAIAGPAALIAALAIGMFVDGSTVRSDSGQTMETRLTDPGKGAGDRSVSASEVSHSVPTRTFTGVITDDHCAARHDRGSGMGASECTRVCVSRGAKYVLVDGDKTYRLEGNVTQLGIYSGTRVQLTGSLAGNRIQVSSIAVE